MKKQDPSVYNPVSPTDTYVIYDQFHWLRDDHLEVEVKGHDNALNRYLWLRQCYPNESLGLATAEYYKHLMKRKDIAKQWSEYILENER